MGDGSAPSRRRGPESETARAVRPRGRTVPLRRPRPPLKRTGGAQGGRSPRSRTPVSVSRARCARAAAVAAACAAALVPAYGHAGGSPPPRPARHVTVLIVAGQSNALGLSWVQNPATGNSIFSGRRLHRSDTATKLVWYEPGYRVPAMAVTSTIPHGAPCLRSPPRRWCSGRSTTVDRCRSSVRRSASRGSCGPADFVTWSW